MQLRSVVLILTVVVIALLAALNWGALAAVSSVSLGIVIFDAPLGLIMLALTVLLGVFFLAYVLSLQGSVLMENRRHNKEMHAQRELADKAEASRFTELRTFLEGQHRQAHAELLARMEALEARLTRRAAESDNATAAYVGQLEHQLRHGGPSVAP
ncbi:MAG: LapA family protein [Acidovorax sp.]|nr:LapA family protein [Acidovorax sp.]